MARVRDPVAVILDSGQPRLVVGGTSPFLRDASRPLDGLAASVSSSSRARGRLHSDQSSTGEATYMELVFAQGG
jgi:hypothetical protein